MHKLFFLIISLILSCNQDYQVVSKDVRGVYEEVEVPTYIEVEVPVGIPKSDFWKVSLSLINSSQNLR